ncbi:MAG: hypothetical protein KA055_03790 [Aliarcobacter sp.]|nr:hypothetical protein [Aliarcobacter sp.]
MKKEIIENIKKLIKINPDEVIEINPNYLEYFNEEELLDIQKRLEYKKENISKLSVDYINEIYEKTKKDEI